MKKLVRYYVGTSYDKDGSPISDTLQFRATSGAERHLAETYGGFSYHTIIGGWVDPTGSTIWENTKVFEVIVDSSVTTKTLTDTKEFLRQKFNQSEVLAVVLEAQAL